MRTRRRTRLFLAFVAGVAGANLGLLAHANKEQLGLDQKALQPLIAQLAASTVGGEYVDRRGASQFRSQRVVGVEMQDGRLHVQSVGCIVPATSEREAKCPSYASHLVKSVEMIDPKQIVAKTLAVESVDVEGFSRGQGLFFDCKGGTPCSVVRFEDSSAIGTSDKAAYIFCPSDEKCQAAKKALSDLIQSLP